VNPTHFVRALAAVNIENVFNPYRDKCPVHDVVDASARRSNTVLQLLEAAAQVEIDALWIGRDLGHRGGRRTGLALTDDIHLPVHADRWNLSLQRATKGPLIAERTARAIWSRLAQVPAPVFLWNVFPFHPHEPERPFTNRTHGSVERDLGEELLAELIRMLRPNRLIAIGNDAAKSALKFSKPGTVCRVRHPSYGGERQFDSQIRHYYLP
jgi:hypothetical protein